MTAYNKVTNTITTNLNIDYTSQFRLSLKHNWKSLKPYYGCSHSCWYCYVKSSDAWKFRYIPKEVQKDIPKFWRDMYIVENNISKLEEIIKKDIKNGSKNKDKYFHLAFCSDPFPYSKNNESSYQEITQNTLDLLKMVNSYGYRVELLTKWLIPVEEIMKIDTQKLNSYGISVPTVDFDYSDRFEPLTSPIRDRIEAIKKINDAGYNIWINIAPAFLWNLINKKWEIVYKFKTWIPELYNFLNQFKSIHHLRIETLRWNNPFKNEISIDVLEETERMFYKIIDEKKIPRYFLDLWFNQQTNDMDFVPNPKIYEAQQRELLKWKIDKIKNTFTY